MKTAKKKVWGRSQGDKVEVEVDPPPSSAERVGRHAGVFVCVLLFGLGG